MQKILTTWSGFSGDYEKYLGLGVGQNSNNHREFPPHFQAVVRAKIVHWTILVPPPHSSKGLGNLWRSEIERTEFATKQSE